MKAQKDAQKHLHPATKEIEAIFSPDEETGYNIFHKIASDNNWELFKFFEGFCRCLIEAEIYLSVDVNHKNREGKTPLHIAVRKGNQEIIAELLKIPNIDPNIRDNDGSSALHLAVVSRGIETVRTLVSCETTNPNLANNDGDYPIDLAFQADCLERKEICSILINSNKIDYKQTRDCGLSAAQSAIDLSYSHPSYYDLAEKIIRNPSFDSTTTRLLLQNNIANPKLTKKLTKTIIEAVVSKTEQEMLDYYQTLENRALEDQRAASTKIEDSSPNISSLTSLQNPACGFYGESISELTKSAKLDKSLIQKINLNQEDLVEFIKILGIATETFDSHRAIYGYKIPANELKNEELQVVRNAFTKISLLLSHFPEPQESGAEDKTDESESKSSLEQLTLWTDKITGLIRKGDQTSIRRASTILSIFDQKVDDNQTLAEIIKENCESESYRNLDQSLNQMREALTQQYKSEQEAGGLAEAVAILESLRGLKSPQGHSPNPSLAQKTSKQGRNLSATSSFRSNRSSGGRFT